MTVYFSDPRQQWLYDFQYRKRRYAGYCVLPSGVPAANRTEAKRCEEIVKGTVKQKGRADRGPLIRADGVPLAKAFSLFAAPREGTPNWVNAKTHIRELAEWFGLDRPAAEIDTALIWEYIKFSRRQPKRVWIGGSRKQTGGPEDDRFWKVTGELRSDSATNRYLATLKTALNELHNTRDPLGNRLLKDMPDVPDLDEPDNAPRPVPLEVLAAIVNEGPAHLTKAIVLTQLFGFRKMEALTVRIDQVDFDNSGIWLDGPQTKGKRAEFLPAAPESMALLRVYVAEAIAAGVTTLVFYVPAVTTGKKAKGVAARSIRDVRKVWRAALKRHGLEGEYTFHNTKASFVTTVGRHASGPTTQNWARHQNFKTTQRYLVVADQSKRDAAALVVNDLIAHGFALPTAPSHKPESQTAAEAADDDVDKSLEKLVGTRGFEPPTLRPPVGRRGAKVLKFQRPKDAE